MLRKDGTQAIDHQQNSENPYDIKVLIQQIKKYDGSIPATGNPQLFRTLTPRDAARIEQLDENKRYAFIFCELVTPESQAEVFWHPQTVSEKEVKQAYSRITTFLKKRNIIVENYQTELKKIQETLLYLKTWSEKPVIIDKNQRDHNSRSAWRSTMQEKFDSEEVIGKYKGPFTDFYESNAIRNNNLIALTFNLFSLWKNFQNMGIDTRFKEQQSNLVKKMKEIDQIKDHKTKIKQQKILINSLHILVRNIIRSIGTDKG